jgi:hypothetical protein
MGKSHFETPYLAGQTQGISSGFQDMVSETQRFAEEITVWKIEQEITRLL